MTSADRISHIQSSFPSEGFFQAKEWVLSPDPFPLPYHVKSIIEALGPALRAFQRACNQLYFASAEAPDGDLGWVAKLMDQGKPAHVVQLGRHPAWRDALPAVIRPDLVMTEEGVCISEIDSLPGGMGLTAWLGQTYSQMGDDVIGGESAMLDGFLAAYHQEDILISRESADYEPEMNWIAGRLGKTVRRTWELERIVPGAHYRFFELFDLPNVEHSEAWLAAAEAGEVAFTPPLKAFLEEKLWLALFWCPQLRDWWLQHLNVEEHSLLSRCIPEGWVMNPQALPEWAVYPGLNIHSWAEMKTFGGKARELVLKISGFSELGWGSRGVHIGHDMSQSDWSTAIDEALASFPHHPFVLQRFHKGMTVQHPSWDADKQAVRSMKARVRLCPYYFVPQNTEDTNLGGVLATVCPADKKILHGMKDALMLPCV